MIRVLTALALGLICGVNAPAALIASYDFNANTGVASSFQTGVGFTAGSLTATSGFSTTFPTANGSGVAQFQVTNSGTFQDRGFVTFSRAAGVTIDSIDFVARKLGANGTLQVTNNVNSEVYTVPVTSNPAFSPKVTINFANLQSNSITLRFWVKSDTGSNSTIQIDNLNVNGTVPEPGSMAVFGVLGLAGIAYRRRLNARV
jgi:hypothetical protein